jgi:hypothetical protein
MTTESERFLLPLRVLVEARDKPIGHARVMADRQQLTRAGAYFGAVLLATSGGAATMAVYDGLDATGDLIDFLDTDAASDHDRSWYSPPKVLQRGLYVDLGSNIDQAVVFFTPAPAEEQ